MKVSTRLSLAEYFYTQGLLFLTLLQVVSLVRVIGPLSQALRLSSLKLLLTWRIIVRGQDMMLFNYVILRIQCVEDSFKLCFISAAYLYCELVCKTLNLVILLPLYMLWLYESDHLRVGYLSRSMNLWFIGILRDARQPSILVRLKCGMTLILREMDYRI